MSRRGTAALVAAIALPLSALPAAAQHDAGVQLAALTYVESSRSAVVDVLLHDDARVSTDGRAPGVRFEGPGRLLGLWLEQPDGGGDFLTSYRLPAFAGGEQVTYGSTAPAECTSTPSETVPLTSECAAPESPEAVLRAGRYRMTVLTDGKPVRIALRLRGLEEGTATVRPTTVLASEQKSLPVRETGGSSLVTFGDVADVGGPAQTFVVARAKATSGSLVKEASVCQREDDGAAPLAYGPHCPGGSAGGYQYQLGLAGEQMGGAGAFASSSATEHEGPVGLGGSFGDSSGVQLEQALGVWLARD